MRPRRGLPLEPPARLASHNTAAQAYRRLARMYNEIEAEIVTRLDMDLLIDYCILMEQVGELDAMRRNAYKVWQAMQQAWDAMPADYPIEEKLAVAMKLQGALADCVKLDGRADRKRSLLLQLRQSLYLTPRARAATAPKKKEPETPPDDLEQLLNDVTGYVNGAA